MKLFSFRVNAPDQIAAPIASNLKGSYVVEVCPLAINLASHLVDHASHGCGRSRNGHAAFGNLLSGVATGPSNKWSKVEHEEGYGTYSDLRRVKSILTALTLRQEGQLQAVATMDSFVLFLQLAPTRMPVLIARTAEWKKPRP